MQFRAIVPFQFRNGAIGYAPGGMMDCLGPYAKVINCPIYGTALRRTCYATWYADTFFSVPAMMRLSRKGKRYYISGFFTSRDENDIVFVPHSKHDELLGIVG